MKPRILVTRRIAQPALEYLRSKTRVDLNDLERNLTRAELKRRISHKEGIIAMLSDSLDEEVLSCARNLQVVSLCASGSNNVDMAFARSRRIVITNTPEALKKAVADLAWALILACARRIPEADLETRSGRFKGWAPMYMLGRDVHGKTLGILGMGRIGMEVARRARGFDMRVQYHNRHRVLPRVERSLGARWTSFDHLVKTSDYLVILTPLTSETRHLFRTEQLRSMKRTSFLLNLGRGPVVEESALVMALKHGWIAGAGLDVYEFEPRISRALLKLPNAVLLPHVGSATVESRTRMSMEAARNLVAVLEGRKPMSSVQ